jgi:allophanate hydrolase
MDFAMSERVASLATLSAVPADGSDPLARVEAVDRRSAAVGDPGIFITRIEPDDLRARAATLGALGGEAGPLWGVPFAVKDNIDVAGVPTTAACPEFAYVPAASAPAVERLTAAGAIVVGKTNLDQFATGLTGLRTPYPVPRNALDPSLVPGGSSSGSAVAVAHGIVPFALGTDTAGSGRVPAALNGIVGLKPSFGLIPTRGVVPACRSLDCVSIFARTVSDAWRVLQVAAGYDAADPWSREMALGSRALPPIVRVGIPGKASRDFGSGAAERAFDAAVGLLGPSTAPVDLTAFFAAGDLLYDGPWIAERQAGFGAFADAHPQAMHPVTRALLERSRAISGAATFAGLHRLTELRREVDRAWGTIDVLVVPTIPDVCRPADVAADPFGSNRRLGRYTHFVNLLDLCAVSVPGPRRDDGLPAGVTFIAPSGKDGLVATLAAQFHATAYPDAGEEAAAAQVPQGTIPIAVVGAHLSGMALNRELTARGATFVRAIATAPSYRLFALAGGPPKRPGLVRVAAGGAAVATEIWALSPAAFGDFVANIPAPLGVGTLRLADGTTVKGFLCESSAIDGAADITSFGGWRAYIAATP